MVQCLSDASVRTKLGLAGENFISGVWRNKVTRSDNGLWFGELSELSSGNFIALELGPHISIGVS